MVVNWKRDSKRLWNGTAEASVVGLVIDGVGIGLRFGLESWRYHQVEARAERVLKGGSRKHEVQQGGSIARGGGGPIGRYVGNLRGPCAPSKS